MFKPPFCPNPGCLHHSKETNSHFPYRYLGFYITKAFGKVPRYLCKHCGVSFSSQTFHIDYYCKKKVSYSRINQMVISASGVRDMARALKVHTDTIQNRIARLSRHSLAIQAELRSRISLQEDLAADGIENFCYSQYQPNNIHLLAGSKSQMVYYFDYVPIRRKGRMTEVQKQKKKEMEALYQPKSSGVKEAFFRLLKEMDSLCQTSGKQEITLSTDENKAYVSAWKMYRENRERKPFAGIRHQRINSKKYRNYQNILFPCNYMDREIRKDLADFTRETVQFGKNPNHSMNRFSIYIANHNYQKVYRIKKEKRDKRTHGEVAGLSKEQIDWAYRYPLSRRFLSHQKLNPFELKLWKREIDFPILQSKKPLPKMVYA